jgi:methylated-DNA-[protein]-cysteine S-methyltransferase
VIYRSIDSPVGGLLLARDEAGLRMIHFVGPAKAGHYQFGSVRLQAEWQLGSVRLQADWDRKDNAFDDVVSQLEQYFEGKRRGFDLPLAPEGTAFQQRVWRSLLDIPYGETISYGELAARIGNKAASRAVGLANGSNPLPIVIPCHRVIGSNGKLTGYGGGLPIKHQLLALERGALW